MAAVEFCDLTFRYNQTDEPFFRNLKFQLAPGSRCLLVGSNGAGKSTLLRIVAGMHMVPERAVLVHGHSAFHDTLFSNNNVAFLGDVWYRTVPFASGNVPYSADIAVWQMLNNYHGIDPERRDRLIDILEVNPEWRMHSVSDGERKRVMILLKLLRPCSILLLDEVTTNLDVIARQDFLNFLRTESEERKMTIIYATHIFDGLEDWMTHLLYLCNGQIERFCAVDSVDEFIARRKEGSVAPLMRTVETWLRKEQRDKPPRKRCERLIPAPTS